MCAVLSLSAAVVKADSLALRVPPPEMATQATQVKGWVPVAKGRLKFKSAGPVCICGEGLSERDIEQGMARSKPGNAAASDSSNLGTGRSQASGQENNLNSGVAK